MPSIKVDGIECAFEGKKSLLQVALDAGVEIPHYCYHPGMSVVASCRICLAEVAQPNPRKDGALELIPKLVPTCQTPAVDGAEVYLRSPKSIANQKAVMEYLLINHPLDCPVCDQAGECSLQDYSYRYGNSSSRFEEAKIKQPKKDVGEHILLYSDRCIMCTRCVRFTREVTGTNELGVFGRGSLEQIDVFPGVALNNELSGNVVDICPVGALLDKDFLMSMRVWNLTKTASVDGITASGDNLSIESNEGKVYRIKPRTNMDVNQWWTSDEIRYGWKFVHSPERFRSPMIRKHGALEECDWNAAYAAFQEQLELVKLKKGAGSVGVLVSPMLPCEEAYLLAKLVLAIDDQATLAVGPVPVSGENKTFPGGYTVYAEKAPNARGVRRALGQLSNHVVDYDAFVAKANAGELRGFVLTGNYPSDWATPELVDAVTGGGGSSGTSGGGGGFVVLIDTLPSKLSEYADLLLPGATWVEKAGTFENAKGRLQSFEQAIPVIELAKPEGQIALDLLHVVSDGASGGPQRYDAERIRLEMGDAFVTGVHAPEAGAVLGSEVEYVQL